MKLIALLLMMPILSLANPTGNNDGVINPETLQSGMNINTVSKFLATKSTKATDGKVSHALKANTISLEKVAIKEAFVEAEKGIVTSLTVTFSKQNGEKFLADIIKKYGMPFGEMVDAYEWKNSHVVFEIHPTSTGYAATYKPINNEVSIAKF